MEVSQAKAARLAGVSRTTIHSKVKNGELSLNANKKIDISELMRVYSNIRTEDPLEAAQHDVSPDTGRLQLEIDYLKQQVETLERMNSELRESLRSEREALKAEREAREKVTDQLIEQTKKRSLMQLIGWDKRDV